jgi:heterodisulfide reductase subunit B
LKAVYYPGCTLHEKARELDEGARKAAAALGIELFDLSAWTCCGAAYPLSSDNVIGMVSAGRILSNARMHADKITTMCSFCYNVLKRVNNAILTNPEKRDKLNAFLDNKDTPGGIYRGEVKVLHYLEMLQEYGFDNIRKKTKNPLNMKVAAYYGCQLLRPEKEMHFDSADNPSIFEKFVKSVGGIPVDFPFKTECCGSSHILKEPVIADRCSYGILSSAIKNGAEALAVTCPLCYYNLETEQQKISSRHSDIKPIPVFYFTELLCIALGLECDMTRHSIDVAELAGRCAFANHGAGVKA